jgi:drug/metabolite transporter (DMT)-like permease
MNSISTYLIRGAIAGAVGTTALNAATFLDMAVRKRPASSTPEQVVERGARLVGAPLPEDEDQRQARESGLGSLLGALAGVSAGVVLGALRATGHPREHASTLGTAWVLAMLAGNGPMTVLGVTDPRTWSTIGWAADVVPHLAYAVAATATLDAFETAG